MNDSTTLQSEIQKFLNKEISLFVLKEKGAVNYAYYIETKDGGKYIVKRERTDKEFEPLNSLITEASVMRELSSLHLSLHVPRVIFVSENPSMYGYEYVEGDMMRRVWKNLSEEERVEICCKLGHFHAEIGQKVTKEISTTIGVTIDMSSGLHPIVLEEYDRLSVDASVSEDLRKLVNEAKVIFDTTQDNLVFQFIHNDSHHENILIKDKKISGIIDFGETKYGEIAQEFSRYIRDFPEYFQYIVSAYEEKSMNKLSHQRLISNALLSGFSDIAEAQKKEGEERSKAEKMIDTYKRLLAK